MSTASIYKSSIILANVTSCILICFAWAIMGYKTQYFKYFWRYSCLSLRTHHGGSCTKPSNCFDKLEMPRSTTGCRIKSFMSVQIMNVEKLRDTESNLNTFSQVSVIWIQKSASPALLATANTNVLFSIMIFANF